MTDKPIDDRMVSGYTRNESMLFHRLDVLERDSKGNMQNFAGLDARVALLEDQQRALLEALAAAVKPSSHVTSSSVQISRPKSGAVSISRPVSNPSGPLTHSVIKAMLANLNSGSLEPPKDAAHIDNPEWWEAYRKAQRMRLVVILSTCALLVVLLFMWLTGH